VTLESRPSQKSSDEIAEAYRSEPWWYDLRGFFILTFAYNSTVNEQLRFFGVNFGHDHLEVACGTGTLLDLTLRWRRWKRLPSTRVLGIDYAPSMLAGARRRFRGDANMSFLHADAASMPLPAAAFDTANVANAVHCLPDVDGALREIFRVLKPAGSLAANVLLYPRGSWPWKSIARRINDWGIRKGILYTPYEKDEIRQRVVDAGFEIVSERVHGNCLSLLARKPSGSGASTSSVDVRKS